MILRFPGEPKAQKRCRWKGKKAYDPSLPDKEYLRSMVQKLPQIGPLKVKISFALPIRNSWDARTVKTAKSGHLVQKPDIDNLAKLVLDALNAHVWEDDSQIMELHLYKYYSDNPETIVEIL